MSSEWGHGLSQLCDQAWGMGLRQQHNSLCWSKGCLHG
jgi:hypothetical protein